MKLLVTLTCIIGSTFGYAQNSIPTDWISFEKTEYKIQHPLNWTIDTSKLAGSEFFIFSPLENDNDKFRENINLIIQDLGGQQVSLDKYAEISIEQINSMVTDGKIYDSVKIKTDKSEYYRMRYRMTQGTYKLMIEQYFFINDGNAFVLTFTSDAEKFDSFKITAEQILNSFVLTK